MYTEQLINKLIISSKTNDTKQFDTLIKELYYEKLCGITILKLENAIIKTNNVEYIYKFAKYIKGSNIPKLEDAIIKTNDAEYIYKFAIDKDIKGSNIPKLEDAIIKTNNAWYIYKFAIYIKGSNIPKLENAIIKINNIRYIVDFAEDVEGANISKLEDAIIETNDIWGIYNFARAVKGANISKLESIIFRTNNMPVIIDFLKNVRMLSPKQLVDYCIKEEIVTYEILIKNLTQAYQLKDWNTCKSILSIIVIIDEFLERFKKEDIVSQILDLYYQALNQRSILIDSSIKIENSNNVNKDLWDINLSLTEPNVLVSTIANNPEVKKNTDLYLDLLKKLDNTKYYDYKDALLGEISFEEADEYYKWDYRQIKKEKISPDTSLKKLKLIKK